MGDDQLSDADIDQLTQLGIVPEKQKNLEKQLELAQALRYAPMPGMVGGYGSRVQSAPSPMAIAAGVGQNVMGGMKEHQIMQQQNDLMQQQARGRAMMAKLLRGRMQTPMQSGLPGTTYNYEDQAGSDKFPTYE